MLGFFSIVRTYKVENAGYSKWITLVDGFSFFLSLQSHFICTRTVLALYHADTY